MNPAALHPTVCGGCRFVGGCTMTEPAGCDCWCHTRQLHNRRGTRLERYVNGPAGQGRLPRSRGNGVTQTRRRAVMFRDGWKCRYCGCQLTPASATVDHIHPRSRGGLSTIANLATACEPCNSRKGARTPDEAGMPLRKAPRT